MTKKTLAASVALAVMGSIALSACSGGSNGSGSQPAASGNQPVTINLWEGFSASETTALEAMIAKYWTPAHPNIKVNVTGSQTDQSILTAMSGGDGPDVVMAPDSEAAALWFHDGAIKDISDLAASISSQLKTEFVAQAIKWCEQGGKTFALPFENYDWGIFYNKKMFAQAGLNPNQPPATISELESDAKKLTKVDASGNITQLGWLPVHDQWSAIALSLAFGAKFIDGQGNPTLDTPAMQQALTWDLGLAKSFNLSKVEAFTSGFTKGGNPFALGKVAIYIDGMWEATMLKGSGIDFGVGAVPASSAAYANSTDLGTNPIVIPTSSAHPAEAAEFAKFMALSNGVAANFAGTISNLPQLKSALSTFTSDPQTKFFASLSNSSHAVAWAPVPYAEQYSQELNTAVGDIYNGGAAVGPALSQAQAAVVQAASSAG